MNPTTAPDSLSLYHAVRRARALAIGAALTRLAAAATRLWKRLVSDCRRRLRLREIAEA